LALAGLISSHSWDAEGAAGAAVELDGGRRHALLADDAHADRLVGADDQRAVGEGVGADGREDDGVGVGAEDRAARGERIGGRTGRRGDDQPVADILGDEIIADLDADAR
jgi:hypothetical protein